MTMSSGLDSYSKGFRERGCSCPTGHNTHGAPSRMLLQGWTHGLSRVRRRRAGADDRVVGVEVAGAVFDLGAQGGVALGRFLDLGGVGALLVHGDDRVVVCMIGSANVFHCEVSEPSNSRKTGDLHSMEVTILQ
jgi:hypothetical protein